MIVIYKTYSYNNETNKFLKIFQVSVRHIHGNKFKKKKKFFITKSILIILVTQI
jgi:hypothetical protein